MLSQLFNFETIHIGDRIITDSVHGGGIGDIGTVTDRLEDDVDEAGDPVGLIAEFDRFKHGETIKLFVMYHTIVKNLSEDVRRKALIELIEL